GSLQTLGLVRVDWLREAALNVDEIKAFIAVENAPAATKIGQRITDAAELLAEFPYLGRPGRVAGSRELVVVGTPYIIAYRVSGDFVQIVRVLHGARRWPPSL